MMKKFTKKQSFLKKAMALVVLCIGLNQALNAQCSTSFTYTSTSSSISATSTSTGTTGIVGYNWDLANSLGSSVGGSNLASPVFGSLYNGTYVLYLSLDSSSCPATSQTITISGGTNVPACSSSFTYTLGALGVVNFTNTSPADPLSNTTYNWNFGNGMNSSSSATNPVYTYYYNGTYAVTLNVYNPVSGCSTSSTQTVVVTNANTAPACNSSFTYTVGASGHVDFTAAYTGFPSSLTWSFGDGNYAIDTATISNNYLYNGTYNVTLSVHDSMANCTSSSTQTIAITNAGTAPCVANVTFSLHQDSLNPQPGVWEIGASYSSQVTSAVWFWGDSTSTSGLSPTHTYTAAGHYNICVAAYASCGDSTYVCQSDSLYRMANGTASMISVTVLNVNNVTGIKSNVNETAQISVYPNPSTGLFTLNLNNISTSTKAQISITNILGEVIYSAQEPVNNNTITKAINLQNIANGAYFIRVNLGNKTYTNKLIKN